MAISRFFSTFGRTKQIRFHFSLDFPLDFFDFLRQVFRSPPMRSRFWKYNIPNILRFCWFSPCSAKYYCFCAGNIQKLPWALDFQNIKNLTGKKRRLAAIPSSVFLLHLFAFFRLLSFGRPYYIPAMVICVAKTSPLGGGAAQRRSYYNSMRCFGKYNFFLRKSNIFIPFMRLERE